ncbi:hypothetical protein HUJ04_000524 [Dendroctonus ponderosae]|nr:hypothetical protein HUJ04_000524 [Dendroctonus ponderosae]
MGSLTRIQDKRGAYVDDKFGKRRRDEQTWTQSQNGISTRCAIRNENKARDCSAYRVHESFSKLLPVLVSVMLQFRKLSMHKKIVGISKAYFGDRELSINEETLRPYYLSIQQTSIQKLSPRKLKLSKSKFSDLATNS